METAAKSPRILRYIRLAIIVSAGLFVLEAFVILFGQNFKFANAIIDWTLFLISSIASSALFFAAWRYREVSQQASRAWFFWALSFAFLVLGELGWLLLELYTDTPPYPSIADFAYVLNYPFFLVGVYFMPKYKEPGEARAKHLLDMAMIAISAFLIFSNFFIGPLLQDSTSGFWEVVLNVTYPTMDLLLLVGVTVLMFRQLIHERDLPLLLIVLSIIVVIVTDTIYSHQSMLDTYNDTGLLNLGWSGSYLLAMIAGILRGLTIPQKTMSSSNQEQEPPAWPKFFSDFILFSPYIWLAVCFILLIVFRDVKLPLSFSVQAVGIGSILALVIYRQYLAIRENGLLVGQLKLAQGELEQKVLERTSQLAAANEKLQAEMNERVRSEEQLVYNALHDSLTGLANRTLLMERLSFVVEHSKRRPDYHFAVLFLDFDRFKLINDGLGHSAGDQMLIHSARRIEKCVRTTDLVTRFGGDEFGVLLDDINIPIDALAVATRILGVISDPYDLDGQRVFSSVSIGIVTNEEPYLTGEEVLSDADIALYHAKTMGKNRFEMFAPAMREKAIIRMDLESDIHHALQASEFRLDYQPIISLNNNQVTEFEALVRWYHPTRGIIPPVMFIHVAEETGLILPLGAWVLKEACRQMKAWQNQYPSCADLKISVNLSPVQFIHQDIINLVSEALSSSGLPPSSLILEITEGIIMQNLEKAVETLNQLRSLGVRVHIDDFGTGYSSLSYLQQLPLDAIKIDRSFVNRKGNKQENLKIIQTIITLAKELGATTIAEGIETSEQRQSLADMRCEQGQGFLFAKPMNPEDMQTYLKNMN
jgi:diguanylate cyclase (GGDEF)-like protein